MEKILSNRFNKIFSNSSPKTKLVAYFVACYPTYEKSLEIIKEAIDSGVSICELGIATQEASGEGPIIKKAHDHCLERNITLKDTLKLASEIRKYDKNVGIILMGYMSNVFKYPIEKFVKELAEVDADGCLIVDAPHELKEENQLRKALTQKNLSLIKLVAPTTTNERLKTISKFFSGWVYNLNFSGVTGSKSADLKKIEEMIKKIRDYTKLPICSGFGIKTPIDAKKVADTGCDGVVVGSSIVEFIEKNANDKKLTQNVGNLIKTFILELNKQ